MGGCGYVIFHILAWNFFDFLVHSKILHLMAIAGSLSGT